MRMTIYEHIALARIKKLEARVANADEFLRYVFESAEWNEAVTTRMVLLLGLEEFVKLKGGEIAENQQADPLQCAPVVTSATYARFRRRVLGTLLLLGCAVAGLTIALVFRIGQ